MPHPYADTLTTLLRAPSSEIVAWLRTEQAKGVLPVGVALDVLIELAARKIDPTLWLVKDISIEEFRAHTGTAPVPQSELSILSDEVERLRGFDRYIQHIQWCPAYHTNDKCTCGLDDLLPFVE